MSTQQDIYTAGSESRPPMLNKENYVPWSRMIAEPGDGERDVNVNETFHEQTDDELSERELKQIEADDQAIQTILLGLLEDIYAAENKAKLFNEWERFTSNEEESIESYYHRFLKLMNDLKRNKHFPEKIASNLKFLNNLQPELSLYVTVVHQTKDLHTADYTQLYDFLKYNQKEVDELKAERLAKIQDPLALFSRKMIPEPGDVNRDVNVSETFHLQTDDELSDKELKQIEADDQAIQTILLGLPEDIYAAEKKAKLFNEWERFTSNEGKSIESYYHHFLKLMNDLKRNKHFPEKIASNLKFLNNLQPEWSRHVTIFHQTKDLHTPDYTQLYDFLKYNQKENYLQQPIPNPEDIPDPTTAMNMALTLMAKAFKLNYSTPTNNNQRISSNPRNRQIAQPGMNMGQDRQIQMVIQNAVQNPRVQNLRNQNGLIGVQGNGNQNQIGNGNLVAARAEGNVVGQNGNRIRCYNCRGVGHYARNCTVRPRRSDAAYLQTQLLIAQKEEAGIQI
nr:hypothetical protein [Tanacetum cinerariifolium]